MPRSNTAASKLLGDYNLVATAVDNLMLTMSAVFIISNYAVVVSLGELSRWLLDNGLEVLFQLALLIWSSHNHSDVSPKLPYFDAYHRFINASIAKLCLQKLKI